MEAPHTCFPTTLPDLPRGYQLDLNDPYHLTALPGNVLPPIAVCDNCWYNACATYDVHDVNTLSAWMTLNDEEWAMLRGLNNAFPHVNAVSHVLYDFLYPIHVREKRTCEKVLRYDAIWPRRAGGLFKLSYRIKYRVASGVQPLKPFSLTESTLRQYPGGLDAAMDFWYGEMGTHSLEPAFLRGLLAQDPCANMILWGMLPLAEACCIFWMYNHSKLGEWIPGSTLGT
jgi:hypothetical protein